MPEGTTCELVRQELSEAWDEGRPPPPSARRHVVGCGDCTAFEEGLPRLDRALARGDVSLAPDLAPEVMAALPRPRSRDWLAVAAMTLAGITIGAVMAGIGGLGTVQAHDLDSMLHEVGPAVTRLSADMVVVERGWHPDVPERLYAGSISYLAPENLSLSLDDNTSYPSDAWVPNDLDLLIADGEMAVTAASPCPRQARPGCKRPPLRLAIGDLPPFDEGVVAPLQLVAPAKTFAWWSGLEVMAATTLDGRPTLQVETTVAAAELLAAVTRYGTWRDLHPTDRVVMWLDESTLVPLRIEVFAQPSPERELWQLRRGYDDRHDDPIFVVALSDLTDEPGPIGEVGATDRSAGFVDGLTGLPPIGLAGFSPHRSGHRMLPDGGRVEVASWSDGRSWFMVESTTGWDRRRLFGMSTTFVEEIDLGSGSVGYLDPAGGTLAIHSPTRDVAVSGSVPPERLVEASASLEMVGVAVPDNWPEASVLTVSELPAGTLVPDVEGWSVLGRVGEAETTLVLTGSGTRSVTVTVRPGSRLGPPAGPDVFAVDVRGGEGRYDAAEGTLEWLEEGRLMQMVSGTVGREELLAVAESMRPR